MSNRKGFTLIELLIVVVIIGILAAIAIPKFGSTKDKAYVAAMKSDLRNLVTAQEGYFADNLEYGTIATIGANYSTSQGVTVTTSAVSATGWSAAAAHGSLPNTGCTIALGAAAGTGSAGIPECS